VSEPVLSISASLEVLYRASDIIEDLFYKIGEVNFEDLESVEDSEQLVTILYRVEHMIDDARAEADFLLADFNSMEETDG
jgi:hypothetical protein